MDFLLNSMTPVIRTFTLLILLSYYVSHHQIYARILKECDAAKELYEQKFDRSLVSMMVCVMKHESHFNTGLLTGPLHKSAKSYGVFQISSDRWCSAYRKGGECNENCRDFLDDDLENDIACARKILLQEGFKHWKKWERNCRDINKLPNVAQCLHNNNPNYYYVTRVKKGLDVEDAEQESLLLAETAENWSEEIL